MARDPAKHTVTSLASVAPDRIAIAAPWDALAQPESDDLIRSAVALLPQGAAWGSPDGEAISLESWHARFVRVLLHPFLALYARIFALVKEGAATQADALLENWEADYGLPDECTVSTGTRTERLRALAARVAAVSVSTPRDFILLASQYGFTITITERCMFRCGFSRCGGQHVTGDPRVQETFWIVHVADRETVYFRAGKSRVGRDPLFDKGDVALLLCLLRRFAPAWTTPIIR